ncbi:MULTISPECIES: DUF4232 domain-containing protein [unclassified Rathayibacter]|uniref:DUF4232 domain-containing protein n=1 Tax=unclassified Rathayibacter TaxID=2609250 RepID=UPI0010446410|nr:MULTISPECIES: DUF4232 domain-containing protein [unclassified Rathayibacter]TCL86029.1 uncharacterized protein DUF4232 [Rathayibacter sp. PhB192]TCM31850.1 uncharacterized protein DUF4232 [Rathayibacter sp. PhB179]
MKPGRACALGGVAVLLAVGIAGCTAPNPDGTAPDGTAASGTASAGTASAGPVPGGTASATTMPSAVAEACALAATSTFEVQDTVTVIVELTDAGTGACVLQGTPEVTFLDDAGAPVDTVVQAGSGEQFSGEPVTVEPGGHAYLTFLTDTTGSCAPTAATVMVLAVPGAPGTTQVDLGSTSFCPTAVDLPPLSYPVTLEPTTLA